MKALQLADLTREELLTLLQRRIAIVGLPPSALLSARHDTLTARSDLADEKQKAAWEKCNAAFKAYMGAPAMSLRSAELQLAWRQAEAEFDTAKRAAERARTVERACWKALEAAWEAERG
ncbi:MAG TPA: hypothetical protein VLA00_14675 [Xanthobacteraceae bacterium]|nr:hypothetical protein [Xanthobacteraceae bacterium]